jgi:uncharacterized membrane protein
MLSYLKKIRPEFVFLILAVFFEWRFNKVTPPLQVPDEFHHFYRALQISEGQFLPLKKDQRLGGYMSQSVQHFVDPYYDVATNIKRTIDPGLIDYSRNLPYSTRDSVFIDFPNTALYTALSYAPQATALYVLKKCDVSIGNMYYGGRYFTFLCWLVGMFFVIRLIPFGKWLMTLIVLLPMNLYLANSFSADTVTNIIALLFIAYVLRLSLSEKPVTVRNLFWLLLLILGLSMAKVVYVGLVVLLFVIPPSQFKNIKMYAISLGTLFVIAAISTWYWSALTLEYYIPYTEYDPVFRMGKIDLSSCANYYIQKQIILQHSWYFPNLIWRSLFDHPFTYLHGYIGAFGNMDILLPRSAIFLAYAAIGVVAIAERNDKVTRLKFKPVFFVAVVVVFVLLILSQHLTWDCVGEGVTDLIQGRYLIAIFPLLFLMLCNTYPKSQWIAPAVALVTAFFLNSVSCKQIYPRFYKESYDEKLEFYCDAEKINDRDLYMTSNDSVFLESGKYRSDSFAYGGKYSAYFDRWIHYNMSYRFSKLKYGDLVEVSAWRRGKIGGIALSGKGYGKDTSEFFYGHKTPKFYDERGWAYLHTVFTIKEDCDSAKAVLFLWCPDSTKRIYFDDLKFSIKHYKRRYMDSLYINP